MLMYGNEFYGLPLYIGTMSQIGDFHLYLAGASPISLNLCPCMRLDPRGRCESVDLTVCVREAWHRGGRGSPIRAKTG